MSTETRWDIATICLNGHVRSITLSRDKERFCTICGAETITACPTCRAPIPGVRKPTAFSLARFVRPACCRVDGAPYPWTTKALEAARELADETSDLSEEERRELKDAIGDLAGD